MGRREWTWPRIVDAVVASVIAVPLTIYFWLMTLIQMEYPGDHVVNCDPSSPQPGDPWVCEGDRLTMYHWAGWGAFVIWLLVVWGGMALAVRRGWWLIVWPVLGIGLIVAVLVLEFRAADWSTPS